MNQDHPIDEMIAAIQSAKSPPQALFNALNVLEQAGGYIILPLAHDPGGVTGGWRPNIKSLQKRTQRRINKMLMRGPRATSSMERDS